MVFRKQAAEKEAAVRMIIGKKTLMRDPHGIAFDPMKNELFVTKLGTWREVLRDQRRGRPRR
jgi:hypothetical protein